MLMIEAINSLPDEIHFKIIQYLGATPTARIFNAHLLSMSESMLFDRDERDEINYRYEVESERASLNEYECLEERESAHAVLTCIKINSDYFKWRHILTYDILKEANDRLWDEMYTNEASVLTSDDRDEIEDGFITTGSPPPAPKLKKKKKKKKKKKTAV